MWSDTEHEGDLKEKRCRVCRVDRRDDVEDVAIDELGNLRFPAKNLISTARAVFPFTGTTSATRGGGHAEGRAGDAERLPRRS